SDPVTFAAADQFGNRLPQRLTFNVPECDVDAAQRMQRHTAPTVVDGGAVHLLPQPLHVEGILTQQHQPKSACDRVGARGFDDRVDDLRCRVHFAYADDARVGVHTHDQVILAAIGDRLIERRLPQNDRLHVRDLHDRPVYATPSRFTDRWSWGCTLTPRA